VSMCNRGWLFFFSFSFFCSANDRCNQCTRTVRRAIAGSFVSAGNFSIYCINITHPIVQIASILPLQTCCRHRP